MDKDGVIAEVRPNSIAAELGLQPGDALLSINGHVLRDVIDYRFYIPSSVILLMISHLTYGHHRGRALLGQSDKIAPHSR